MLVHASASYKDFDDVDTLWLKNVTVQVLPIGNAHSSMVSLKITGLAFDDIEDGIHIKPTFSASNCIGNETTLSAAPSSFDSDMIVSLVNFHFKQHSAAYLCIKTKYDQIFQHMGPKSKFPK